MKVLLRKFDIPDAAVELSELRRPPGNRLEALSGPEEVEIADYH